MFLPAVTLDASMSASAACRRLAINGLWLDPQQPDARRWIAELAARMNQPIDDVSWRLAKRPERYGVAVRRQYGANILWYARPVVEVLQRCAMAPPDQPLLDVLNLHESDSRPPIDITGTDPVPPDLQDEGVVIAAGSPVAISVVPETTEGRTRGGFPGRVAPGGLPPVPRRPPAMAPPPPPAPVSRGPAREVAPPPVELSMWPRIDAPSYVPALIPFQVTVGFAELQQRGVAGGQVTLSAPAGATTIDIVIELIADGLDAPAGWSRNLAVSVANPYAAAVTFELIGRVPVGPEPVHLTTLDVRYVLGGTICGTASKPMIIGQQTALIQPPAPTIGANWLAQPAAASSVTLTADPLVADLTIELASPDRNAARGFYICRLYSPHTLTTTTTGPFDIDFGEDAKTFAHTIVDGVRQYGATEIADNWLRSIGSLVSDKLPPAALDALREVAAITAPAPPAVLLVSAEPYVPWELALIDPPLDPTRPPFLGAQAIVGRWFRDSAGPTSVAAAPPAGRARVEKPPTQPPGVIPVKHMAVMAGKYKATSGLRDLPGAEQEAASLATTYDAIPLPASLRALKQLLDAALERNFEEIGGAGAMHFAGHGDFDPARPDSSVMFLSDGSPLSSLFFRSARYGDPLRPFIFLNACMIGIGGELLGDMGGFPGNCLRGGFGAVLGALWEVDDTVASRIALEFWDRALPTDGTPAESVGAILRDLRAKSSPTAEGVRIPSYLAYVYYGHPRLTLERHV